jgi:hypothetical protein
MVNPRVSGGDLKKSTCSDTMLLIYNVYVVQMSISFIPAFPFYVPFSLPIKFLREVLVDQSHVIWLQLRDFGWCVRLGVEVVCY